MPTFVTASRRWDSVDDFLGARENRYFGDGFRRGKIRFLAAGMAADGRIEGTGVVEYPGTWSVKAAGAQRLHLSTLDAYLLGVEAAAELLRGESSNGVERLVVPQAWVRRCVIKAGNAPIEDSLNNVPVSAVRVNATSEIGVVHSISVTVGNMLVSLAIESSNASSSPDHIQDGNGSFSSYATDLRDVRVGSEFDQISATAKVSRRDYGVGEAGGLESAYGGSLTFAEAFADMLQLGQIGLYLMDGITREDSKTLWMRSTRFETRSPIRPRRDEVVSTSIRSPRIVHKDGARWRVATLSSDRGPMTLTCSVAHELPSDEVGGGRG